MYLQSIRRYMASNNLTKSLAQAIQNQSEKHYLNRLRGNFIDFEFNTSFLTGFFGFSDFDIFENLDPECNKGR